MLQRQTQAPEEMQLIAYAAGLENAEKDTWRKAPAQCPIYCKLIEGQPIGGYGIHLAQCWSKGRRALADSEAAKILKTM